MSKATDAVTLATAELGKPYVYGAEGPGAFDCSGLVQWVYSHVGIGLPRTAAAQQAATTPTSQPAPGDLVFWGEPAYHVGIYLGAGQVLDAPHTGAKVQTRAVWGEPTYGKVSGSGSVASATAPLTAANAALFSGPADWADRIVGSFRDTAITVAVAGLGIALVALGGWRSFGSFTKGGSS